MFSFFRKKPQKSASPQERLDRLLGTYASGVLEKQLPPHLYDNFTKALGAYETAQEDEVCHAADEYFYAHEQEIIAITQAFADAMA